MIKHKIVLVIFMLAWSLTFTTVNTVATSTAMDENGIITFLKANPQTIMFDLRWEQLYEQGHLPGAYLIDSSLTNEQRYAIAEPILTTTTARYSTPIVLYCNCGSGDEASSFSTYLASKGYTNTVWLKYSFSYWQNYAMLVSGPNRYGPTLTTKPDFSSSTGLMIDPILAFLVLGILVIGIGTFIYYRNQQQIGKNTEKILSSAEKKQASELDTLQKLIKQRKEQATNKKPEKVGKTS